MVSKKQALQLSDSFLFPKLFQAFRIAVGPGKLMVALLGLIVICLAGYVMDFSRTVVVAPAAGGTSSELDVYMTSPSPDQAVVEFRKEYEAKGSRTGVFSTLWDFGSKKFHTTLRNLFEMNFAGAAESIGGYFKGVRWAMRFHYGYCLAFALIKLAVFSVVGGAVCRMAALQFARGEKPGVIEALRFSSQRFTSFFFAPILPVIGIGIIAAIIFVLGLTLRIPYLGELIVMAPIILLVLVLGAAIAAVIVGTVGGFDLMFPAVAYDGSDAFDAMSRSFSYVFSRPWRMCFYTLIAAVHGAVCYVCVRLLAFILLSVTHLVFSFAFGLGGDAEKLSAIWARPELMNLLGSSSAATAGWTEDVAAFIIYLFLWVVAGLVVSVAITYYFSANTIIYSLMRKEVDNAGLDEIYDDSAESEMNCIADSTNS
ncbi:MAG TPA: hypothetical protein VJJ98_10910 [Sedimentisphaerales bacterium]|nr:hypothetical protein [Sedimentisphaerales bacterium]